MAENRRLGCGCGVFCFVIVLMLGVYLVLGRPAAMVRGEIVRIAREGAPVTLKDLDGEKIPDSRNGAVVYQKAFALVSGKSAAEDMRYISRATAKIKPLQAAAEWDRLKKIVSKYDAVIPIVEEAQTRPECRFDVNYQKSGAFHTQFTQVRPLTDLSRLLCAKAIVGAMDGKTDEAVHCLELGFGINNALKYHSNLIGYLVRMSTVNTGATALRRVLANATLSDKQVRQLSDVLEGIDLSEEPAKALEVERALTVSFFDDVRRLGPSYVPYTGVATNPKPRRGNLIHTLHTNADEMFYLRRTREYIDASKRGYTQSVRSCSELDNTAIPKYALLSNILLPVMRRSMQSRGLAQVELDGSRIALALASYKIAHKCYPARLSDLADSFIGKIPLDIVTGNNFVYKRQGKGYLLYSIGLNMKDDGGVEAAPPSRPISEHGDIVWRTE